MPVFCFDLEYLVAGVFAYIMMFKLPFSKL